MTIKKNGGVFGRNPKFRNVAVDTLTVGGALATFPATSFTAARTDAAQSFTGDQTLATGNLVIGTAGKGIDFSADPGAAGMTSELLDDYEEGTWTPAVTASGGSGAATYVTQVGTYTKTGRQVTAIFSLSFSVGTLSGGNIALTGLPFTSFSSGFSENFILIDALASAITSPLLQVGASSTSCLLLKDSGTTNLHDTVPISVLGGGSMSFRGTITYFAE